MAELYRINLGTHLESILAEYKVKDTIYGYPKRKIYFGFPGLDFSVNFHDRKAATLVGPASGPHSQMVQNIILSFLAGGRIIELKTIQILDRLQIPRPCIDIRNIGFNVEWSQELRLEDSYEEYVTAWILLKLLEELEILEVPKGHPFYDTIFDISVGYDLKGISSQKVKKWLAGMKDASEAIARILDTLPPKFKHLKNVKIPMAISSSVTLSTFHGCPADEIEAIVKHLISEHRFHVIVKMNPTILGYERVREILHDHLGYYHIELDPRAFEHDVSFEEAVTIMKRLEKFARNYGVNVGAKFTNTLVVKNNQNIFKDEVMYLSGAPLHVLAMTAMHEFRQAMGEKFLISFSAGITKHNFVDAVLCNMKPITSCTDLLKEGGYARMFDYLRRLKDAMEKAGTTTIEEFIISQAGSEATADVYSAGMRNAERIVPQLIYDRRYHYESNRKTPPKIDSHLWFFDCITCYKCLPVCPNAANFSIPTGTIKTKITNYRYEKGRFIPVNGEDFELKKKEQIATLADFCNECGNCDTYCPEHGGPYIEKPRFFFSEESYQKFEDSDGFYFPKPYSMRGRINGIEYELSYEPGVCHYRWHSPEVEILLNAENEFLSGKPLDGLPDNKIIDMKPFYMMRVLFDGILRNSNGYSTIFLTQQNNRTFPIKTWH